MFHHQNEYGFFFVGLISTACGIFFLHNNYLLVSIIFFIPGGYFIWKCIIGNVIDMQKYVSQYSKEENKSIEEIIGDETLENKLEEILITQKASEIFFEIILTIIWIILEILAAIAGVFAAIFGAFS